MGEECKVVAFEYFQDTQPDWYNFIKVSFDNVLDSIHDNFKEQLDKFKADYAKLSDDDKKWLADEMLKRGSLEDKK